MPTIKPISELQRNAAALVREAMETKEPIYLTKNGSASVVLLDAEEYDRQVKATKDLWRSYVRTGIELGEAQIEGGHFYTLETLDQLLRERWGDDAF